MAVDGKVIIEALLDTKKAQKSAQGLGSHLKSGLVKGTKLAAAGLAAAGAAATATAGAVVKVTKATMEYGVEVNRNSQKLNMSKKGYQEWSYVLKRSGTSIDSLRMGMKKISTQIDEARNGSKSATENFKRLGLSVDDLKGKSQEEIFSLMVKRLQGIKDTTERSAIANKFFGRSAQEMAGLLNKSGKEVEGLKKQAHDLGLVLSDDAIKKSAEFRGKLTELQSTFEGLRNKMAVKFLPSLTKVTDGLGLIAQGKTEVGLKKIEDGVREFTTQLNKMTPKILQLGGTILKSLGKGLLDNLPVLINAGAKMIISIIRGITKALPILIKQLPKILSAVSDTLIEALDTLSKELPSALGGLASVLSGVVKLLSGFLKLLTSTGTEGKILRGALIGLAAALVTYKIATTVAKVATDLLTASMNTNPIILLITALIGAVTATVMFADAMKNALTYEDDTTRRAEEASKKYQEFTNTLKENAKAREENVSNARAEGNELDFLYKKLVELNKVEHKSKAQKEEMKSIVKQLNEKLPDLKLRYDEEKDSLNKSTKAIKKNIEQRKKKIMVDALEENAKKIAKDRADAEEKYNELVKAGTELEEKRKSAIGARKSLEAEAEEARKNGELGKEAEATAGIKLLDWQISKYDESIKANDKQTSKAKTNLDELSQKYDESFVRIDNAQNKGKFDKLIASAKKAGVEVPQALKSGFETGEVSLKEATTRLKNAMKIQDLNKGVKGKAKQTVDDIVNAYLSGTISAKEASRQLRDAGLKGLSGGKKKAKEHAKENPEGYKEGAKSDKKGVEKATKEGTVDQAKKGTKGGRKEAKKSGENFLRGFIDGLESIPLLGNVVSAAEYIAKKALGALRKTGGEGSPWSTTTDSGEFFDEGIIKGIKNKKLEVQRVSSDLAKSTIKSFDQQLLADSKYSTGYLQSQINTAVDVSAGLRGLPGAVKEGMENANVEMKVGEKDFARLVKKGVSA